MLIKEFDLDLETISREFESVENIIINDAMTFYINQFGVSFKHYSMQNVLRLADYLVDYGPQQYGKPLAYLIERLHKNDVLDEAKHLLDNNFELVKEHLSDHLIKTLGEHVIEEGAEIDEIHDNFGPVS